MHAPHSLPFRAIDGKGYGDQDGQPLRDSRNAVTKATDFCSFYLKSVVSLLHASPNVVMEIARGKLVSCDHAPLL
jgi:hypothetical protein